MQILRPNQTFRVLWVTADPSDNTTYFPQVTIKETLSGKTLLAATNLVLDSAGRYYYDWIVPGDTNGGGTQIDVTVIVYTDSGHSLYSSYERENRVYNIFDLASLMRGGGGGASFDWEDMRKLIKQELEGYKPFDYSGHFGSLQSNVFEASESVKILEKILSGKNNGDVLETLKNLPTYSKEFQQVADALSGLGDGIAGSKEFVLTGIQNLTESIGSLSDELGSIRQWINGSGQVMSQIPNDVNNRISQFEKHISSIEDRLKQFTRVISKIQYATLNSEMPELPEPAKETPKKDYSFIAKKLV